MLALLFLLLLGGFGIYLYRRYSGLTVSQMWHQLTTPSADQTAEKPSGPTDAEIKVRLLEALFNQPELRKQNVTFSVSGGVVTFSGEVEAPRYKAALEQLGQQIAGVKKVVNNVTVKASPSASAPGQSAAPDPDQQLAKRVEFALYQTDAFNLKLMTITARDGRVRLSGSVRSLAEKLLAERIAREVEGVSEVINELAIQPGG
ncbi:MAG: BON domain-containing protein [Acidobacteria bacterium]|nr:BON domain-containing protein [Acidobacteriota bacterium]